MSVWNWKRNRGAALAMGIVAFSAGSARAEAPASSAAPSRREPSAGDLATARTALKEGLALREKGDLSGAVARLTTAYDLVQTPVTGFELGKAEMMSGRILVAHEFFQKVARMPQTMEESSRSATAREEAARLAAELEPRIPSLRIHLTLPPGATAVVRVDDDVLSNVGPTTPRSVDPGRHEIVAKAGDGPDQRVTIDIAEGETKDVALAPQWLPPKAPPEGSGAQVVLVRQTNSLVFIGFGASSAALVLTGLSAFMAVDAAGRAKSRCGSDYCPEHVRNSDVAAMGSWLAVTGVAGAATIGFLVMGIVNVSNPVKEKVVPGARPYVGLGSLGVAGRF